MAVHLHGDILRHRGEIAQLVEHTTENRGVPGSSPGLAIRDGVFHTYSTYGRGAEMMGGWYYWLDLTALGRQEEWEEPKGRADAARDSRPDFAS